MKPTNPRGGKREGAGRPKSEYPTKQYKVYLRDYEITEVAEIVKKIIARR